MNPPLDRDDHSRSVGLWLFGGSVAALLSVDALLLLAGRGASIVRLRLALGAGLTVLAGVALGVARKPAYAVGALSASPVVVVYAVSGLLLPWDQVAFAVGQSALEAVLAVPLVGDDLATALFGGTTLSARSLRLAFRYHYTVVAVGTVGLAIGVVRSRQQTARGAEGN